jgi:hypothetical protein
MLIRIERFIVLYLHESGYCGRLSKARFWAEDEKNYMPTQVENSE